MRFRLQCFDRPAYRVQIMASFETDNADRVDLWDQYRHLVDLFRFYLDLIIKANIFYSAVAGGIISYVLSHMGPGEGSYIRFTLYIPILISVGFSLLSFIGFFQSVELHRSIQSIGKNLKLRQVTHSTLLPWVTMIIFMFHFFLAITLIWFLATMTRPS